MTTPKSLLRPFARALLALPVALLALAGPAVAQSTAEITVRVVPAKGQGMRGEGQVGLIAPELRRVLPTLQRLPHARFDPVGTAQVQRVTRPGEHLSFDLPLDLRAEVTCERESEAVQNAVAMFILNLELTRPGEGENAARVRVVAMQLKVRDGEDFVVQRRAAWEDGDLLIIVTVSAGDLR